jgi:tungstate transport system ATP-binding protein
MNNIFEVKGLIKEYDGKTVLNIEHLKLENGKINAVIGPSGAGKSTLLQLLNGVEIPTEGVITFHGEEIKKGMKISVATRRKMSMVFQKPTLFNSTVFENVAYPLKIRNEPKDMINRRVSEILYLVGLHDKSKQRALTLSGGEAQRIALARAIVTSPKALLLDEPTANLDPANVELIEKLIEHARTANGSTVIIVTHNMFQAKRLGENIIFMLNGRVVETGPADKLFTNPENEKTLAFINGEMVY